MSSQYACYRNGKLSTLVHCKKIQEEIEEYITISKKNKKKARDIIVKQYGYLFLDGLDNLELEFVQRHSRISSQVSFHVAQLF